MTISTTAASIIVLGDGVTTQFQFPFVGVSAADISVIYTNAAGTQTLLPTTSYTITLNPAAVNQLWGIGGFVTYINSGSPIAVGTSLTITRTLPLTQTISIANQGLYNPQVVEQMGDKLEMQIQQVAARTGQIRGVWATGISYNFGDVVQDGANGTDSLNYYMCAIANTSGTWATDLANGDWSLAIQAGIPATSLPLPIALGGTSTTTAALARAALGLAIGTNVQAWSAILGTWSGKTVPSGAVIGTTDIQPLSNKTITNSTIDNTSIGLSTPAAGIFTSLTFTSAVLTGAFTQSGGDVNYDLSGGHNLTVDGSSGTTQIQILAGSGGFSASSTGIMNFDNSSGGAISITSGGSGAISLATTTGDINLSPGSGAISFSHTDGTISTNGSFKSTIANKGLVLKRGSNGRCGTFTVAGASTVNVSNTAVVSTDVISLSINTVGGTSIGQARVTAVSPGSQFSVSAVSGDVSVYNYMITSNLA